MKITKGSLDTLIFFCTSRCNGKCLTCFYQPNLNKGADISLEQIESISKGLPSFRRLMISGGEPFLRKDLDRVVKIFVNNNGVSNISIPTNGLLAEDTLACVEKIASDNSGAVINIACSMDGFKTTHDKIRGIDGVFDKAEDTFNRLLKIRARHKNLRINIATTICAINIGELKELGEHFFNTFDADFHYFELIRGDVPKELTALGCNELEAFDDYAVKLSLRYRRRSQAYSAPLAYIKSLLNSRIENSLLKIQRESFFKRKKWPIACEAGKKILVMQSNGFLSECELKPQNQDARKNCSEGCTHGCFLAESAYSSRKNLVKIALSDFFKL